MGLAQFRGRTDAVFRLMDASDLEACGIGRASGPHGAVPLGETPVGGRMRWARGRRCLRGPVHNSQNCTAWPGALRRRLRPAPDAAFRPAWYGRRASDAPVRAAPADPFASWRRRRKKAGPDQLAGSRLRATRVPRSRVAAVAPRPRLVPAWLPLRRGPAAHPMPRRRAYASRWALTTARTFSRTWSRYSWVGIQLNMKGASGVWKPSPSSSAWMFLGPSGAQP